MSLVTALPHNQGHCKPNCFGCKADSVGFSSMAMPTRSPNVAQTDATSREMEKDRDAYLRFKKDGVQPKGVNGAAAMEQAAHTNFEVESGRLFKKAKVARKYEETQHHLTHGGLQPLSASAE